MRGRERGEWSVFWRRGEWGGNMVEGGRRKEVVCSGGGGGEVLWRRGEGCVFGEGGKA